MSNLGFVPGSRGIKLDSKSPLSGNPIDSKSSTDRKVRKKSLNLLKGVLFAVFFTIGSALAVGSVLTFTRIIPFDKISPDKILIRIEMLRNIVGGTAAGLAGLSFLVSIISLVSPCRPCRSNDVNGELKAEITPPFAQIRTPNFDTIRTPNFDNWK